MRQRVKGQEGNLHYSYLPLHTSDNLTAFCKETGRDMSEVICHAVSIYLCNWLVIKDHEASVARELEKRK